MILLVFGAGMVAGALLLICFAVLAINGEVSE